MKESIDLCIDEANAFFDIAVYCDNLDAEKQQAPFLSRQDAFYFFPAIINLTFAAELFLKALLLLIRINKPQTHGLSVLFNELPINIKTKLGKAFSNRCKYNVSIEKTLEIHEKAFVKWRYAFEETNQDIEAYFDNLRIATEVVREEVQIEKNNRKRIKHVI